MSRRSLLLFFLGIFALLLLTACHPGHERYSVEDPAGFVWGLWHGAIALLTLIGSIFTDNVTIYESYNTGFWYNLGFLLGVGSISGGSLFTIGTRS